MREGKLEAKQEVMYIGTLSIAQTKWGRYVRKRRYDVDRLIAEQILKIPGFIVPYFLARFKGPESVRKIRVVDKVINCPKGLWVKLPITIDYKIRGDSHFQVGPEGKDPAAQRILKQQTIEEDRKRKVTISRPKPKHKPTPPPATPQIVKEIAEVTEPEKKEEKTAPVKKVSELGLPSRVVRLLNEAGIMDVSQITSTRVVRKIKGIGPSSARQIMKAL